MERKGKVIPFRVEGTKIEKALEPTVESLVLHSHRISSVQDGISALGKSYMRSIPSLRSFHNVTFETVPMFARLTMASLSSFQARSSNASSFHASLLTRRSMVCCPWLCDRRLCLKFLNTSDLPRSKPLARVAFPASISARSFPFTPASYRLTSKA